MKIDISTLLLILWITITLQVFLIYLQAKLNKNFHDIKLWIWGSLFIAIGILLMFLRNLIPIKLISIILSNILIILGQILNYIGTVRFLGKKERRWIVSIIALIFTLSFTYFTYVSDNMTARIIIISISMATISLIAAFELLTYKNASFRSSCIILGFLFLLHGVLLALRGFLSILMTPECDFFNPSILQVGVFFVSVIGVYLWSYGLIFMINQKTNSEKSDALEHFQLIFDTSPDAMVICSFENGEIVEVNKKFITTSGYSKEEAMNQTITDLKFWHSEEDRVDFIEQLTKDGYCENYESVLERKNGLIFQCLISATLIELNGSTHVISVIRDITERKLIEEKIRILSQAVEQSPASIIITDTNGAIQYVNNKFIEVTGYSFQEVEGKNPRILKSGLDSNELYKDLWNTVLQGNEWTGEFHNRKKNGELYWESARISPIFNSCETIVQILAIKEDITERKRLEDELQKRANLDALTGISNRRHFMESVENELIKNLNYPKENAFLMIDIDHFKYVNDNFGHATGDVALVMVAKVCKETLRPSDIFGRVGGEEFSAFLVDTDFTESQKIAESLRSNIENIQLFDEYGSKISLFISIGLTNYRKEEDTLQTLMMRSDQALYQAKNEGRNRVVIV